MTCVFDGEKEVGDPLLVQSHVPADHNILLGLGLLHLLVIISLQLDEGPKDVLVLVGILIPQEHRVGILILAGLFKIFEGGHRVILPHVLELHNLGRGDLPGPELLLVSGDLDEPGEEGLVLNDGGPLGEIPRGILVHRAGGTGLPAQEDDDRIRLGGDEPEEEDVATAAIITLEEGLPEGPIRVQDDLLVLGADQVVDDVGARGVAGAVAKPLFAMVALDDRGGRVDPTISAGPIRGLSGSAISRGAWMAFSLLGFLKVQLAEIRRRLAHGIIISLWGKLEREGEVLEDYSFLLFFSFCYLFLLSGLR